MNFVLRDLNWVELAYQDYTIHKQTYLELEVKYHKSEKTLRKYFDSLNTTKKADNTFSFIPQPVNCIFDTTFLEPWASSEQSPDWYPVCFKRSFGVMVFRANHLEVRKQYTHKNHRSAFRSIKRHFKYLFTLQDYPQADIPPTTNSCDGSFGHWKAKVKLHRGISLPRKQQIIDEFLK